MKKTVYINIHHPESLSGYKNISIGSWLTQCQDYIGLSNVELSERLLHCGYCIGKNFISMLRKDETKLPVEHVDDMLKCLDYEKHELSEMKQIIITALLVDRKMPKLADFFDEKNRKQFELKKEKAVSICRISRT